MGCRLSVCILICLWIHLYVCWCVCVCFALTPVTSRPIPDHLYWKGHWCASASAYSCFLLTIPMHLFSAQFTCCMLHLNWSKRGSVSVAPFVVFAIIQEGSKVSSILTASNGILGPHLTINNHWLQKSPFLCTQLSLSPLWKRVSPLSPLFASVCLSHLFSSPASIHLCSHFFPCCLLCSFSVLLHACSRGHCVFPADIGHCIFPGGGCWHRDRWDSLSLGNTGGTATHYSKLCMAWQQLWRRNLCVCNFLLELAVY